MNSPQPVDAFDQASLEAFTSELVAAGFEPVPETLLREWTGPIHHALAPLTDADRLRILIRDGWPVTFPYLFADGLHTNHLTDYGYVCLWHEGDGSQDWVTLEGFFNRLAQWSHDAQHGWDPAGLARDAQLNFRKKHSAVATFDLEELQLGRPGTWGSFHGEMLHEGRVDLRPRPPSQSQHLSGLWFRTGPLGVPPRNLSELQQSLNRSQARGLSDKLASRRQDRVLEPSGSVDLILLCWDRDNLPLVLVLALEGIGDDIAALALQPGPTDKDSLLLRAGPDANLLQDKTVIAFGAGALGGHVALALAESGITRLLLADSDLLLPENAVRHVVGHQGSGIPKSLALKFAIRDHAPWTDTDPLPSVPLTPDALGSAIADADLVVDSTGNEALTRAISLSAAAHDKRVVSGALYRGGAVARVQRQGAPGDTPILERRPECGYELIPPGNDDDMIQPAIGCSGPVHNAPPAIVLATAALMAEAAIDVLSERYLLPDEIIHVHRPLAGEPLFDKIGRLR